MKKKPMETFTWKTHRYLNKFKIMDVSINNIGDVVSLYLLAKREVDKAKEAGEITHKVYDIPKASAKLFEAFGYDISHRKMDKNEDFYYVINL